MNIGIDCRTILNPESGEKAGVGHYTYYLVKHLLKKDKKNTYTLFFDHKSTTVKEFKQDNVRIRRFKFSEYKRYLPFVYSHGFISQVLNKAKLDVFHAPANVIPLQYKGKSVVTVHDLAIYQHPEWFPEKQSFSTKVLVPKSMERADHIIAVSESTQQDLFQMFPVSQPKTTVVYEGVSKSKRLLQREAKPLLEQWGLNDNRYILYVGTLEPRKNIAGIIKAFDQLALKRSRRYKDVRLIIAGAKGYKFEDNYKAITAAKSGKIRYVGYVSAAEKQALMQNALAFVFPSLYEGFGLPVLEAMRLGTPVITSNVSSMPEVAGKAAKLVKPNSLQDISQAIDAVVSRKATRDSLSKRGKEQAKQFSWDRCAKETLAVYERVGAQ